MDLYDFQEVNSSNDEFPPRLSEFVKFMETMKGSSKNTIDRLVTLMKRDAKAQMYTDKYLRKLLASSLDIVIYMNNFKVQEIVEVDYDEETDDIKYNSLYEFKLDKYENGKSVGKFKKVKNPSGRVKRKIDLNKSEIERVME